jgi:hypothetical protein
MLKKASQLHKKMKINIILAVVLLSLVSCIGGGDNIQKDIYTGTQGVLIDIFDMPSQVTENQEIPFIVRVENKGPYDTRGRILIATERDFMTIKGVGHVAALDFTLKGKTVFNDRDDFQIFSVPLIAGNLAPLSETRYTFVSAYVCYEYKGLAFADVCIDTDPYKVVDSDRSCRVQSSIPMGTGQGGPVAIERIEPVMLIQDNMIRPQFKIYIRNKDTGTVIQKNSIYEVCSSQSVTKTANTLTLTEVEFSGKKLSAGHIECLPRSFSLEKEQDFITCTVIPSQGIPRDVMSYMTPLKIEIDYGYAFAITKELSIKKILTY